MIDVMAAFLSRGCICILSEIQRMGHLILTASLVRANWIPLNPNVARQHF